MPKTPHRLRFINYKIHLEPDLVNFRFYGQTDILIETPVPASEISVNVLDMAIWRCQVMIGEIFVDCPFLVDPRNETVLLAFPIEMEGTIILRIEYEGIINDKMAGFYRSQYTIEGKEQAIAVTQFQENDARRAFPCLDHPREKATFDVELVVDKNLMVLSNEIVSEEECLENGKKRIRFEQTPKMSTYLLFMGVGTFECIENETDSRIRGVTMPGLIPFVEFGTEFGRKALLACEQYFGIPYPLPKLDLIAIPDFAYGAMENWGAITFRENLLLNYPEITSSVGEERICEVIAHEIAHQWFGNLVSPSDWKYLWLNESFATFFAYGILHYYFPEWFVWDQFLHTQTDTALERDALHETFPIEIPGGEHIVINTSTASIIYNKGGSILRQIEGYIGMSDFQKGIGYYLKKHAYDCASSHDLWEAFETVTDKPITRMMKSWIEQPGFPIVKAKKEASKITLTQKRFTYLPNATDQSWVIPITVNLYDHSGNNRQIKTLFEKRTIHIDVDEDLFAYKINGGQTGFFRVQYLDKDNLEALGQLVLNKTLSPEDRWGLQNDIFALVRSGDATMNEYLNFISFYENEDAYLPLISISNNLLQAHYIFSEPMKGKIATIGKLLFEKVLANIGYEPIVNESHTTAIIRDQIIWHLAVLNSEPVIDFALKKFDALFHGEPIHPNIIKSIMQIGASKGNETTFNWMIDRLETSNSEHDRMNVLLSLGCFGNLEMIERVRQYILNDVPDRNKFVPILTLTANPRAIPSMWDWFVDHISELEQCHPIIFERIIQAIVPRCGIDKAEKVKTFLNEYISVNDKVKDIVRLSLEKLETNLLMRTS